MTLGRAFVHPVFDYLVIGGGLSLIIGALVLAKGVNLGLEQNLFAVLLIVSNGAHFAASSVRLYTRPGAVRSRPFLTLAFPVIAIAVGSAAIIVREPAGLLLFALYGIWVPYHYSAQAYGLSAMYAYRSGASLDESQRQLLRGACFVPFAWGLLQPQGGAAQVVRYAGLADVAGLEPLRAAASMVLALLVFAAPLAVFARLTRRDGIALPLICLLIPVSNAVWWTLFTPMDAFLWATVFHGAQYLAIVLIFHVRDRTRRSGRPDRWRAHALGFYAICVAIGYVLFHVWPHAYALGGFNLGKSMLLVTAVVNIHHFVVDAYIWKLRHDPNYRTVVEEPVRPSVGA